MIGAAMRHVYYCDHRSGDPVDHAHLAAGDDELLPLPGFINIRSLAEKGLKNVFDGFEGIIEPNLFQLTNDAIGHAVSVGVLQYGKPNPAFLAHMQKTGTWFSARKTYQQQQELARLLMADDGKTKRTWREFKKAADGIIGTYNERWLKTEYNTAIRAARNGSRWKSFEDNADLYPNLEYLPSRAATPREEHKPFYHVIRPLNDDFWAKHYPPSDYNCVCGAEPTDSDVTPLPEVQPAPAPGLDHNPGQTKQVFSDTHPITAQLKADGADIEAIDQEGERLQREADYATLRAAGRGFLKYVDEIKPMAGSFPDLTEIELASIRGYADTEYMALNQWLQGKRKTEPYLEAYHRVLNDALAKLPVHEGTVYRGTNLSVEELALYKKAKKSNKPLRHPFFVSTTDNGMKAFSRSTFMEIKTKTGRRVEAISDFGAKESEILMPAGSNLKILSVKEKGGRIHIVAEEL